MEAISSHTFYSNMSNRGITNLEQWGRFSRSPKAVPQIRYARTQNPIARRDGNSEAPPFSVYDLLCMRIIFGKTG